MIRFFALSVFLMVFTHAVYAASDDFTVQTLVGNDTTPPTVPANLTATPVAISQIDLAWDPSTDNFLLDGYQVFRDNTQIATTTATSYSDVGLSASTTYTYHVTAFDAAGNVSASSTAVATTTLASSTPPTPTTTPSSGGAGERVELEPIPLEIVRLEIIPETHRVVIEWETRGYVRSILRWGRSSSYEIGALAERSFSRFHRTEISGLSPDTSYQFTIVGENAVGETGVLTQNSFRTLPAEDRTAPLNVSELSAVRAGDDVVLTWSNPTDQDFDRVRILRSDRFYPSDTADGAFVYEGAGTRALDAGAATPGSTQFYTVFSYDTNGNISSGAIVALRISDADGIPTEPDPDAANPIELTIGDIQFVQDGAVLTPDGNTVFIDGTKRLSVSVPYARLPEHLKTILITLTDPDSGTRSFSFLLRVDEAKEWYTATLAPLGVEERYPFSLRVFDFATAQIGTTEGILVSEIVHRTATGETPRWHRVLFGFLQSNAFLFFAVLGILLCIGTYLIYRDRSRGSVLR